MQSSSESDIFYVQDWVLSSFNSVALHKVSYDSRKHKIICSEKLYIKGTLMD